MPIRPKTPVRAAQAGGDHGAKEQANLALYGGPGWVELTGGPLIDGLVEQFQLLGRPLRTNPRIRAQLCSRSQRPSTSLSWSGLMPGRYTRTDASGNDWTRD